MVTRNTKEVFVTTNDDTVIPAHWFCRKDTHTIISLKCCTCDGIIFLLHPRHKGFVSYRFSLTCTVRLVSREDGTSEILIIGETECDHEVPVVLMGIEGVFKNHIHDGLKAFFGFVKVNVKCPDVIPPINFSLYRRASTETYHVSINQQIQHPSSPSSPNQYHSEE